MNSTFGYVLSGPAEAEWYMIHGVKYARWIIIIANLEKI